MTRILGALLILTGGLAGGLERVAFLRRQLRLTEALEESLHRLRADLTERLIPLPELLAELAGRAPVPARGLFAALHTAMDRLGEENFGAIWATCVTQYPDPALDTALRDALTALGGQLGRYSAAIQSEALERCITLLAQWGVDRRQRLQGNARLALGLYVCGALALVVLLL